ncbi:hypothetical protein ACVIHH_008113 [Bradyrhizobium sp. USDA 4518]|nr:hypothetical protein [Bradyrhizobium sp. USDA 4545]MCP1920539.1 hypothetical protein [Bradyrhizobium sp. USDA 4532]
MTTVRPPDTPLRNRPSDSFAASENSLSSGLRSSLRDTMMLCEGSDRARSAGEKSQFNQLGAIQSRRISAPQPVLQCLPINDEIGETEV